MITIGTNEYSIEYESLDSAISECIENSLYKEEVSFRDTELIFSTEKKYIDNTNEDYYLISVEYTAFNYRDELRVIVDAIHEFNKLQGEKIVNLMTGR